MLVTEETVKITIKEVRVVLLFKNYIPFEDME